MPEEFQDDSKKTSKEIWLFLIFVDIVALCVFGFFIYKSFSNDFDFSSLIPQTAVEETITEEELSATEELSVPEIKLPEESPAVKEEKADEPASKAEEKKEEVKKVEEPVVKEASADKKEPAKEVAPAPKKQSVFISGTGKTRKVTFKYYGEGKKVSIVSGFTMRKPVALKKSGGVWSTTLVLYPGEYRYMFIVDGVEKVDPNAKQDEGRSVLIVK